MGPIGRERAWVLTFSSVDFFLSSPRHITHHTVAVVHTHTSNDAQPRPDHILEGPYPSSQSTQLQRSQLSRFDRSELAKKRNPNRSRRSPHLHPSVSHVPAHTDTMSGRSKVSVQPINIIFRHLQQQTRVSLWLYDNVDFRIEGKIIGFDEFMNVTLADAEEVWTKKENKRVELGRILLKGDNIVSLARSCLELRLAFLDRDRGTDSLLLALPSRFTLADTDPASKVDDATLGHLRHSLDLTLLYLYATDTRTTEGNTDRHIAELYLEMHGINYERHGIIDRHTAHSQLRHRRRQPLSLKPAFVAPRCCCRGSFGTRSSPP